MSCWREAGSSEIGIRADQTTFAVLSRYAAMLDKQFFRALHELQRLQQARGLEGAEPVQLVDVDIDLESAG